MLLGPLRLQNAMVSHASPESLCGEMTYDAVSEAEKALLPGLTRCKPAGSTAAASSSRCAAYAGCKSRGQGGSRVENKRMAWACAWHSLLQSTNDRHTTGAAYDEFALHRIEAIGMAVEQRSQCLVDGTVRVVNARLRHTFDLGTAVAVPAIPRAVPAAT